MCELTTRGGERDDCLSVTYVFGSLSRFGDVVLALEYRDDIMS